MAVVSDDSEDSLGPLSPIASASAHYIISYLAEGRADIGSSAAWPRDHRKWESVAGNAISDM